MTRTLVALGAALLTVGALRLWLFWRSRRWIIGERNGTTVIVRQRGRFLELVLERGGRELVQSRQRRGTQIGSGRGYVDGLHLGMLVTPRPEKILFLGGGACMAPRQFEAAYPDATIDVVEKDPLVITAANRHFGFRISKRVSVHAADAFAFVTAATFGPYDLVIFDVYDAVGIPAPLATEDFFARVRSALTDTGVLVANLAHRPEVDARQLIAHVASAFPRHAIATFEVPSGGGSDNAILLVAPRIPTDAELAARAAEITVAPFLPEIVRHRSASR